MLGQLNTTAVSVGAVTAPPAARPPPVHRVVESAPRARQQPLETGSTYAQPPTALEELTASVRQFADVLEITGNVHIASSVSGFRAMFLDLYA